MRNEPEIIQFTGEKRNSFVLWQLNATENRNSNKTQERASFFQEEYKKGFMLLVGTRATRAHRRATGHCKDDAEASLT